MIKDAEFYVRKKKMLTLFPRLFENFDKTSKNVKTELLTKKSLETRIDITEFLILGVIHLKLPTTLKKAWKTLENKWKKSEKSHTLTHALK